MFKKTLSLAIEQKFEEKKSIEILKILGLINNIEEYQKIYNHG